MAKTAIGGTASFLIDGKSYSTNGEFEVLIQSEKREVIASTDGQVHFTITPMPSKISGSLITTADLDAESIVNMSGVTVQVDLANGKTAVINDAIFTGEASISAKDGSIAVEFQGVGQWI